MTTATAPTVIETLVKQLGIVHRVIHRNLEGVSQSESMVRPQPAGNSANWVVGHIVASRSGLLGNFGEAPLLDADTLAQYRRGSDGDLKRPKALADLLEALDESQPRMVERLRSLTIDQLTAKSPFNSPAGPDASLADALAAMVFHESYHSGQLGVLRRVCGKDGAI